MYYAIDSDGVTFKGTTLKTCLDNLEENGSYSCDTLEVALNTRVVLVFKGQAVTVKVIPPSYQEVIPPKVVKKPVVKQKRGK